jgi:hypothetical protein
MRHRQAQVLTTFQNKGKDKDMFSTEYNAKLVGFVYEGELDVRAIDEVNYNAFYDIYKHGQELWDAGRCSKYIIAVVADTEDGTRMVGHVRPDKDNFTSPLEIDYIIGLWEEESCIALYERHFGGSQWNATFERIFEDEYECPIANA